MAVVFPVGWDGVVGKGPISGALGGRSGHCRKLGNVRHLGGSLNRPVSECRRGQAVSGILTRIRVAAGSGNRAGKLCATEKKFP